MMNTPTKEHIHWETITPEMRQVMVFLGNTEIGKLFYLAGGTALSLQLGHRRSVDLDFFTPTEDVPSIQQALFNALNPLNPITVDTSWGNLVFLVNGVQVGFYGYGYSMLSSFVIADNVRLASVADIGLMKLDALLARASRKDFHDLYRICQSIPLQELLAQAPQKYPSVRDFEAQVAKRFVFFEHAEQEEPPPLIKKVSWGKVKSYFRQQAIALGKNWLP